ncbi:glycosyltransferase [Phormidium sp. CCY1219]|uniref:glycosyltransferase n=1 Tax=Phormidium sp. CCY1219 TaxID=2886104 RepID=UPI002D1E71B8|nr:glycosyltransferase [Phormidium sp. CCY1219]MEB3829320.1 glycosyltransferase [Phormidium sp. CCY1219]
MSEIAIFLKDLDGGGAERVMLNLAEGFAWQGMDVDLVLVTPEGPYLSQISPQINAVNLNRKSLLRSLPDLVGYLKRERPKVLLSALEDTNLVALWAKSLAGGCTRTIVTVHNTLSRESRHAPNLKRKFVPYLIPWVYPIADAVVCVSRGVAKDLNQLGLRGENIHVIYNPIVTPPLQAKQEESIDHPWFSPGEPPVILGVGRLNKQKDFPTLIRAFAKVRENQSMRLMLLGEGEERSHLESLVRELGIAADVALPGFVANPYAYMARSALLVLSSAWEGFGNVLVEAMSAGTPVVSTNCESGPAEILAEGTYGKLVPVGDSEAMATAIAQTLAEVPDGQVLQTRAAVFSAENAIAQYRQLFPMDSPARSHDSPNLIQPRGQ